MARRLRLLVTWTKCTGVRSITLCGSVCIRLSCHYFLRAVPARVVSQAMFLSLLCYPASYMSYVWGGGAPFPSEHGAALLCEGFGSMDPTEVPLGQICIYIYSNGRGYLSASAQIHDACVDCLGRYT